MSVRMSKQKHMIYVLSKCSHPSFATEFSPHFISERVILDRKKETRSKPKEEAKMQIAKKISEGKPALQNLFWMAMNLHQGILGCSLFSKFFCVQPRAVRSGWADYEDIDDFEMGKCLHMAHCNCFLRNYHVIVMWSRI